MAAPTRSNDPAPIRVLFAMEQHLGHRTYAANLRTQVDGERYDATWTPVEYRADGLLAHLPMPDAIRSALACRQEVRRGVRHADADVHVFNTQVPAVLGGRAARSRPYIVITDVTPRQYDRIADAYGHTPDRPGPVATAKHRLNRHVFTHAAWCVGWSRWVRDSFVADYGVEPDHTEVIPPGVDTADWQPGAGSGGPGLRILFVGGDFERKGGPALLRAFAQLPDDCELVVVTKSRVPRADRVRVVDDLGPNDPRLVELFRTSDVFALPSLAEAFGIAAAEASAAGLPVVGSDVGGLPDIVEHGVTGFVVPPGDDGAIARALLLLGERETRDRMGAAARRRAEERFDARTNALRLLDLVARSGQPG